MKSSCNSIRIMKLKETRKNNTTNTKYRLTLAAQFGQYYVYLFLKDYIYILICCCFCCYKLDDSSH